MPRSPPPSVTMLPGVFQTGGKTLSVSRGAAANPIDLLLGWDQLCLPDYDSK